jgi:C1A family cysteine protease
MAVTPVKDQNLCGAGWAYATISALESSYYINSNKTVNLTTLSVQQVLDCAVADGCRAQMKFEDALTYANSTPIEADSSYPNLGGQLSASCANDSTKGVVYAF